MKKVPSKIQKEIKAAVYEKADAHGYMHRDRTENGVFMENLVKDAEVGGRLAEYMLKAELKTYIKDAILNRYAKDKTAAALAASAGELIRREFSQDSDVIESKKNSRISLHRLANGDLLIVAGGTLLKWETALRKVLEYIAKAPGLPPEKGPLKVLLNLATNNRCLTESDKGLIKNALGFVGVKVSFAE
jgi:hypothetical protein